MNRQMSKQKRATIILLVVVIAAALIVAAVLILSRVERAHYVSPDGAGTRPTHDLLSAEDASVAEEMELELSTEDEYPVYEPSEDSPTIYHDGRQYRYNTDLSVLLILGIDDRTIEVTGNYRNQSQADFLLVAVFDHAAKTCRLIQINRDTMADVPVLGFTGRYLGITTEQIALAHTYGVTAEQSGENTVTAVSRFLYETPIDNYFALTMDAIPILNDLVGGVTVTVEDDFTGVDDTLVQGETVTLTADNVENFVRSRMSMRDDPTNIARMRRQRTYITALIQKLSEAAAGNSSFALDAYGSLEDYIVTDCSIDQMNAYASQFSDYTLSEILVPEGESVKGEEFMEFYVDEDALQQLVLDTFYVPVEE